MRLWPCCVCPSIALSIYCPNWVNLVGFCDDDECFARTRAKQTTTGAKNRYANIIHWIDKNCSGNCQRSDVAQIQNTATCVYECKEIRERNNNNNKRNSNKQKLLAINWAWYARWLWANFASAHNCQNKLCTAVFCLSLAGYLLLYAS